MARGVARGEDDIRDAVIRGNGDKSVIAKELGCSVGQVNNYLYRYPGLNDIYKAQRRDLGKFEDASTEKVDEEVGETQVLTVSQKRVIDDIDAQAKDVDGFTNVNRIPTTLLLKLEEWGLVALKKEADPWYGRLTDDGEIALITGEFTIKSSKKHAPKQIVGRPTTEPKKHRDSTRKQELVDEAAKNGNIHPLADDTVTEQLQEISDVIRSQLVGAGNSAIPRHAAVEDCADCAECLHRDVLEYLMERNPDVKELYKHVAAMKEADKQAQAILKKFGG